MQLPLLALQNISLTFGVVPLLSGAALTVAAGDRIFLVLQLCFVMRSAMRGAPFPMASPGNGLVTAPP